MIEKEKAAMNSRTIRPRFYDDFYCGEPGCPGHQRFGQKCDSATPRLRTYDDFYCGEPGCPGHVSVNHTCSDKRAATFARKPTAIPLAVAV